MTKFSRKMHFDWKKREKVVDGISSLAAVVCAKKDYRIFCLMFGLLPRNVQQQERTKKGYKI